MISTFENYKMARPEAVRARPLKLPMRIAAVAIAASLSVSCGKTTYTQNIPFDPAKTLADHGFSTQSGSKTVGKRNADGSVECEWRGTIASSKPNDWEALPGLWRDDIEEGLGFKSNEKFPSPEMRKPGEAFEGLLLWTENGISEEMRISLKPGEATKRVEYRISVKGQWVKK